MVSTVSTRGVKFKFSEGERVLCYEPDPTKAKVLYESKILELVVSRDECGRKVPEYLIHFFGWNSSWDRRVREEFILPYTEENSELQAKLATEAALSIKGKRKIKLPPLIKETLAKKQCTEDGKQKNEKQEKSPVSSSDSDSSDDESERNIVINIPDVLKKELEEDFRNITKCDKFVKLPTKPNVIAILEAYVKHLAGKLLCASPPKNAKNGTQLMPEDVKNNKELIEKELKKDLIDEKRNFLNKRLNLSKEAMDGIRIYFDFTLPHLLLYRQEKKQYYTEGISCSPISSSYKWEPKETIENVVVKIEKVENEINISDNIKNSPVVKVELENIFPCRPGGRKSPRSMAAKLNSLLKQENLTNGEREKKPENTEKTIPIEKNKKSPKGRPPKTQTTRVLRSSEKQKPQLEKEDLVPKSPPSSPPLIVTEDRKHSSPSSSPTLTLPSEPSNSPRVTRKSARQSMSPPRIQIPAALTPTSRSICEERQVPTTSNSLVHSVRQAPSSLSLPSNCMSSSNSSSHSTFSTPTISHEFHLINNEALLQEVLSWRLIPQHLYDPVPAAPSLIYGAQHLLRLFVKLPDLLSKMNMSKKKMVPLLDILENLLLFMAEKRNELFQPSAYSDACDEDFNKSESVCSTK